MPYYYFNTTLKKHDVLHGLEKLAVNLNLKETKSAYMDVRTWKVNPFDSNNNDDFFYIEYGQNEIYPISIQTATFRDYQKLLADNDSDYTYSIYDKKMARIMFRIIQIAGSTEFTDENKMMFNEAADPKDMIYFTNMYKSNIKDIK